MKRISGITALACCLVLAACSKKQQAAAPVVRNVLELKAESCTLTKPYACVLSANGSVEVRPKISGYIFRQFVNEGDFVKAGQQLFTIDPIQVQAEVDVARANIEVAQAQVETAQLTFDTKSELFRQDIISANDLQMAKNSLAAAKATLSQCRAALTNAERNLDYCNITSPIGGVLGVIAYLPGNLVSSSSERPLVTVTDISTIRCYFSISEREALQLSRMYGSPDRIAAAMPEVQLRLADGSLYNHTGKIVTVSGVPDERTGAIRVRADFPNPEQTIKSGFSGTLLMPTRVDSAVIIPQQASFEIQSEKFVYVLTDSNTVHATPIQVMGLNDGRNYVVIFGLEAGQRIVTDGVTFLREGQAVSPKTEGKAE
ncbi:MAG: efflux RND transporter periplasmic adaptor subunit [Bacteroides sp.]|nr:efflux RND transporter periplasmic adaptor subunit [Ruminococcus flavefaciens]MCM1555747.1 efflux RND transporter periplasmic adaptor subunit [Bacteroides sp.]